LLWIEFLSVLGYVFTSVSIGLFSCLGSSATGIFELFTNDTKTYTLLLFDLFKNTRFSSVVSIFSVVCYSFFSSFLSKGCSFSFYISFVTSAISLLIS